MHVLVIIWSCVWYGHEGSHPGVRSQYGVVQTHTRVVSQDEGKYKSARAFYAISVYFCRISPYVRLSFHLSDIVFPDCIQVVDEG